MTARSSVPRQHGLCALTALVLFFVSAPMVRASVPSMMNYQGYLTDLSNMPRQGSFEMTFSIYADSTGGSALWSEGYEAVSVVAGLFNVLLGSTNPLPASLFAGDPMWLETTVSDTTLTPRRPLVTVPYSFRAQQADLFPGGLRAQVFVADGTFIVPPGVTRVFLTMVGGGAGGVGRQPGPGGGAGAMLINFPFSVTPGQSYVAVVGAGGVSNGSGVGEEGRPTSFGPIVCAGAGVTFSNTPGIGAGGYEGVSASGSTPGAASGFTLRGGNGGAASGLGGTNAGGGGGGTLFGSGGAGGSPGQPGASAAPNTGAGGGGAGGNNQLGGNGGSGILIVYY
jgi:hypothetical protein